MNPHLRLSAVIIPAETIAAHDWADALSWLASVARLHGWPAAQRDELPDGRVRVVPTTVEIARAEAEWRIRRAEGVRAQ